jgi:hypothetical protein
MKTPPDRTIRSGGVRVTLIKGFKAIDTLTNKQIKHGAKHETQENSKSFG